jgi:hypothetical protein
VGDEFFNVPQANIPREVEFGTDLVNDLFERVTVFDHAPHDCRCTIQPEKLAFPGFKYQQSVIVRCESDPFR